MATIQDLQTQRTALVEARHSGALRTTFRDGGSERTVFWKSDSEMAAAIASIDQQINGLTGTRVSVFYPTMHKGF